MRFAWPSNLKQKTAFTLIELMVVIAIIAICASLLIPTLARAKQSARSVQCKGNVRQLALSLAMYVQDFNCYPAQSRIAPQNQSSFIMWPDVLEPYSGVQWTNALYKCPDYSGYTLWHKGRTVLGSYGYNGDSPGFQDDGLLRFTLDNELYGSRNWLSESKVKVPNDMVAIGDVSLYAMMNPRGWGEQGSPKPTGNGILLYSFGRTILPPAIALSPDPLSATRQRHGGRLNVALCDGHIESIRYERLFESSDRAERRFNYDNEPHRNDPIVFQ